MTMVTRQTRQAILVSRSQLVEPFWSGINLLARLESLVPSMVIHIAQKVLFHRRAHAGTARVVN